LSLRHIDATKPTEVQRFETVESALGALIGGKQTTYAGGSGASVLRATTTQDGLDAVVKFLQAPRVPVVKEHDLGAFRAKVDHHLWLRDDALAGSLYPAIYARARGDDFELVVMEFCVGDSPLDRPFDGRETAWAREVAHVLDVLFAAGYRRRMRRPERGEWDGWYVRRPLDRIDYLNQTPIATVASRPRFEVNGISVSAPATTLERARLMFAELAPEWLTFPLHGDLNMRNIVLSPNDDPATVRLLDPRGDTRPWDALYDVGKMLFSLTLFEDVCNGRVSGEWDPPAGICVAGGSSLDPTFPRARSFIRALESSRLSEIDGAWREWRLPFVHACHFVAEAACRISARSIETGGEETSPPRGLGEAFVLFGVGSFLLDRCVDAAARRRPYGMPGMFDDLTRALAGRR
jgi:hypothetical protein